MSSLTSDELNYLVFRYLQESGLTHAAFVLGHEAGINKSNIDGNMVPVSSLIKFVQKGLQYLEMEANLSNSEEDIDEDFSFFQPLDLITKDVKELQDMVRGKKRKERDRQKKQKEREREREKEKAREKVEREKEREREKIEREKKQEMEKIEREKERERKTESRMERLKLEKGKEMERDKMEREKCHEKQLVDGHRKMVIDQADKKNVGDEENRPSTGAEPMNIVTTSTSQSCHISSSDVIILQGHTSEVSACAWSPSASCLASGSSDATVRIWSIPVGSFNSGHLSRNIPPLVLNHAPWGTHLMRSFSDHAKGKSNEKMKDVTTLDWNGEGTLLATGSCDGQARIWTSNGKLISTLRKHEGPIFCLKWNRRGDHLLTVSEDKTAVVWDVKAEKCKEQFRFHTGPILDVDWRNNTSFATSSGDSKIYFCKIGDPRSTKSLDGHEGEVNCVRWDPTLSLLASCSDDTTAKIWSIKQYRVVHDLREHTKEVYSIRWSPTGPGTNNPNKKLTLASASFDSSIKLWDVELGKRLCNFKGHRERVFSIAFSPDGEYIASGSLDKSIHIWSIREEKVVKTYTGNGEVYEVCWNKEGNKVAGCFSDNTVCVFDFRM